jgi:cytochrome P450
MSDQTTVPDHVCPELVRDFDYHRDPRFTDDPFGPFDSVRDQRAFFSTAYEGYWVLTRAEDIREAFQAPEVFSSSITGIPAHTFWPRKLLPLELDPPDHGRFRHPLARPFSPAAVLAMEPHIRQVCVELVDGIAGNGCCEFLSEFAAPFPTAIFVERLGLPAGETKRFVAWNDDLLHAYDDPERRAAAGRTIAGYLSELVERRAAEQDGAGTDLVGLLLEAEVDGRPLTTEEISDYSFLLFMAGLDTVTAALSFMFAYLARHPDHRAQLVADPSIIPSAVEELLRYHAFVNPARTVTRDVEFAGVSMRAGDRVLCSTALAGRDPHEFADAADVCLARSDNRHLAFGAGPHRCLGSHLARAELRIALEEFHRRIPDYSIEDGTRVRSHGGGVLGIDHLPLRWNQQEGS